MRVFITGGSGYIGNTISKNLLSNFSIVVGSKKLINLKLRNKIIKILFSIKTKSS